MGSVLSFFNSGPLVGDEGKAPSIIVGMLAEFFGSWLLVFVGAGAGAIQPFLASPDSVLFGLANGLALAAAIWIAGSVPGGGQINPVVTLMLWAYSILEREPRKYWWFMRRPHYPILWILAQFLGAIVAGALLLAIFGGASDLGRPLVGPGFTRERALAYESIGSAMLFFVYLFVIWTSKPLLLRWAAIPVGLTYLVLASVGAFISSSSFNWWRHLGPTLISNTWDSSVDWLWYVGPIIGLVGALLLSGLYWILIRFTDNEALVGMQGTEDEPAESEAKKSLHKRKNSGVNKKNDKQKKGIQLSMPQRSPGNNSNSIPQSNKNKYASNASQLADFLVLTN